MYNDNGFEAEITLSNTYTMSDYLYAVPRVISRKSFQTTQHPVRPKISESANMDGSPFDFSGRSLAFSKDVCASVDMYTLSDVMEVWSLVRFGPKLLLSLSQ